VARETGEKPKNPTVYKLKTLIPIQTCKCILSALTFDWPYQVSEMNIQLTNSFLMQGGNWKNWKRRWFVLNDRCLYYFQHTAENSPKGIIPLEGVKVRPLPNKNGKDWVFEIFSDSGSEVVKGCKTDSHGAVVQGNHKQYRMAASTQEERDEWIRAIEESIEENPFCRIIEEKKASRRHMEQNAS